MVVDNGIDEESLEELIQRIEKEYAGTGASGEANGPIQGNIAGLSWLLNRIAKVFEDKKTANENGKSMDKKVYVRQEERKRENG